MAEKKAYPLRINVDVLAAVQRWADDELRSLNAQIEYLLRDALRSTGRLKLPGDGGPGGGGAGDSRSGDKPNDDTTENQDGQ